MLILLTSCSSFPEPTPEALRIAGRAVPFPPYVRTQATVRIESEELAGVFDAIIASAPGPRIRVQLFPDLGGKVLDLAAGPDRLVGFLPQRQAGWDHPLNAGARPHFLLLVAITLLEESAPLERKRILGARQDHGEWEYLLEPIVPESEVILGLDREGRILHRRFRYGGAGWRERFELKETIIMGRGVLVRLEVKERTTPESLPDDLFTLRIPEGIRIQDAR